MPLKKEKEIESFIENLPLQSKMQLLSGMMIGEPSEIIKNNFSMLLELEKKETEDAIKKRKK